MRSPDPELETRLLAVLPLARGYDRERLLSRLGRVGGRRSEAVLAPIVERTVKAPSSERAMALQGLAQLRGADGLAAYRTALGDRDLFVQMLALGMLRLHDRGGVAAGDAEAWVRRRMQGRKNRKIWDFGELPLAVGYFAAVGRLEPLARVLVARDADLLPVERRVLERMWPLEERGRCARGEPTGAPDLTGLGDLGHSHEYYVDVECETRGLPPLRRPTPSPEHDAEWLREAELEDEAILARLERRLRRD